MLNSHYVADKGHRITYLPGLMEYSLPAASVILEGPAAIFCYFSLSSLNLNPFRLFHHVRTTGVP